MKLNPLWIVGGIGLYFFLNPQKATASQINIRFVNLDFKPVNVFNSLLKVNIDIVNTSTLAINLQSITGIIQSKNKTIGKILLNSPVQIPANKTTRVTLPIDINNIASGQEIIDFANTLKLPELNLKSVLQFKGFKIPFEKRLK
jgi:hypothetical protein